MSEQEVEQARQLEVGEFSASTIRALTTFPKNTIIFFWVFSGASFQPNFSEALCSHMNNKQQTRNAHFTEFLHSQKLMVTGHNYRELMQ